MRGWAAAIGADVDPDRLAAAAGPGAEVVRDGDLLLAATGGAPARGCLLDGSLDDGAGERSVAAAWRAVGLQALPRLRGAFCLLLWGQDGRDATLVRDQLGQGGGVWVRARGGVLAAAEPSTLLALLATTPSPDPEALAAWLGAGAPPPGHTLLTGVHRVPPGAHVRLQRGSTERFWTPRRPPRRPAKLGVEEAAGLVRTALDRAVDRATASAAAPAVLLSGGLDSSAIAAVATRRPEPVRASVSAVFPEHPSADETGLIDTTTRALGLSSLRAEVHAGGGVLRAAAELVDRWALPPVTPNGVFWLPLLRAARAAGIDVLLDGQGGDELFGLSPFLLADRLRRGDLTGALRLVDRVPGAGGHARSSDKLEWLVGYGVKGALGPNVERALRRARGRGDGAPEYLAPALRAALARRDAPEAYKRTGGPRWWAHLVDAVVEGPGPALAFDDIRRRDALCGVRSRHPIVDVDLVELVLGLRPELAYDGERSRPLLRGAVAGDLPDEVRLRAPKSSFDAPFHTALAGPDAAGLARLLAPGARVTEFVDLDDARAELLRDRPPADGLERQRWGLRVWRLATTELWLRKLADPAAFGGLADELGFSTGSVVVASAATG